MTANSDNRGKSTASRSLFELFAAQDPARLQQLIKTMTAASQESQGLLMDILGAGMAQPIQNSAPDPFGVVEGFNALGQSLASNPTALMQANLELWQGMMTQLMQLASSHAKPVTSKDRRFSDPEWSTNPMLGMIRASYELNSKWLMSLIETAPGIEEAVRQKTKFFAQQSIDAFAPTNFFATNPAALRRMIESGGDSVLQGLQRAREDIKKGNGKLTISHTDETAFSLGNDIATAKGKVVFRNDLIELIQYEASTKAVYKRPLLIFPPWINKFYILNFNVNIINFISPKFFFVANQNFHKTSITFYCSFWIWRIHYN